MSTRSVLGRGMSQLMDLKSSASSLAVQDPSFKSVPLSTLVPSPFQPRHNFDEEALEELAMSIKAQGLLQPIVVRPVGYQRYEIIAGERRFRAAQKAGLSEVPVWVRDLSNAEAMAAALIENIQRQELNSIEEARALLRLQEEFQMTHQDISEKVGRSRAAISNLLRLLQLCPEVQDDLARGLLDMGHARAILSLPLNMQKMCADCVIREGLSVRATERWVREAQASLSDTKKTEPSAKKSQDPDVLRLQRQMSERLGTSVVLKHGPKASGTITIHYHDLEQFEALWLRMMGE